MRLQQSELIKFNRYISDLILKFPLGVSGGGGTVPEREFCVKLTVTSEDTRRLKPQINFC